MTDSWSEIYCDISYTSLGVSFIFCMEFTWQATNWVVEMHMVGLYWAMIGRLRQLSEPRLRQQAEIEKSQNLQKGILLSNGWEIHMNSCCATSSHLAHTFCTGELCSTRASINLLPQFTFLENILVEGWVWIKHRPDNERKSSYNRTKICLRGNDDYSSGTMLLWSTFHWATKVGWLVALGLTALWDSISVYIGPSPKERETEERKDRWE